MYVCIWALKFLKVSFFYILGIHMVILQYLYVVQHKSEKSHGI